MENTPFVSNFSINPISYLLKNESFDNYMVEWKDSLLERFTLQLENMKVIRRFWMEEIIPKHKGDEILEALHHCRFSKEKINHFFGREQLLNHCLTKILCDSTKAEPTEDPNNELVGITLAIIGQSGTGKTSLMAKLAARCFEQVRSKPDAKKKIPIIIRFCGSSEKSTDIADLLNSVIFQILFAYNEFEKLNYFFGKSSGDSLQIRSANPRENPTNSHSRQYADVLKYFQELITQYPVILFLDSLDQLSNQFEARSQMSFLKFLKPHSESRIIVSCLPDEWNEKENTWRYHYYCDTRLAIFKVPRVQIHSILCEEETREDISGSRSLSKSDQLQSTIENLLLQKNRRLTPDQMTHTVFIILQENLEPSILYLHLVVQVIQHWRGLSHTNAMDCHIGTNVRAMVNLIFDSLEARYGKILTSNAFALLTYSREGSHSHSFLLFLLFLNRCE
jgi:hypothetical protein